MSEFQKTCTTCKQQIRMSNNSGRWLPYNLDNTFHKCLPEDAYTSKEKKTPIEMVSIPRSEWESISNGVLKLADTVKGVMENEK